MGFGRGTAQIPDPRRVKKPVIPFLHYVKEQYSSGRELPKNEKGKHSVVLATRAMRDEYANLSPEAKKVCCVFSPPSLILLLCALYVG